MLTFQNTPHRISLHSNIKKKKNLLQIRIKNDGHKHKFIVMQNICVDINAITNFNMNICMNINIKINNNKYIHLILNEKTRPKIFSLL